MYNGVYPEDVAYPYMTSVKLLFTSERGRCTAPPSLALLTRPNFMQKKVNLFNNLSMLSKIHSCHTSYSWTVW